MNQTHQKLKERVGYYSVDIGFIGEQHNIVVSYVGKFLSNNGNGDSISLLVISKVPRGKWIYFYKFGLGYNYLLERNLPIVGVGVFTDLDNLFDLLIFKKKR